ncbi:MAG TPA: bifunctional helix-turn-helix transcriptional regulator/GNAT family N-acetyltransferase [Gemmatimonadales bacterium]|nr:bifunctional helix-turn-helix transcriptional regulator/GNAT family N-acetyltransferase [Gemmatimonadales bacterium]
MAARPEHIAAVRRFNRFYTRQIGLLDEHLNGSPFSYPEARILYELAHQKDASSTDLVTNLGMDPGYVSRLVTRLDRRGLVTRRRSAADGRLVQLNLSERGRLQFGELDAASQRDVGRLLGRVRGDGPDRIIGAMRTIEELLGLRGVARPPVRLRRPRPGDLGWVVERNGAVYAQEYKWGLKAEALFARIVADFQQNLDPERERCWIAESLGRRVGCVLLAKKTETVAQLRMLLVEPGARGFGLGRRLVDECTQFAREAGYRKIVLWTNRVLSAARHIYESAGYRFVKEERHHDLDTDPIFEVWELKL